MARRRNSSRKLPNHLAAGTRRRLNLERLEDRLLLAIMVDTYSDVTDPNDGLMTLREAILKANAQPGLDVVKLAPSLYENTSNFDLVQGELVATEALTIEGDRTTILTVSAGERSRVLNITATTGDFQIIGIAFRDGRTIGNNTDENDNTFSGGALRSITSGTLTLESFYASDSSTIGDYATGGGIYVRGPVSTNRTTIEENATYGDHAKGGGIHAASEFKTNDWTYIVRNRTIGDDADGGGLYAAAGLDNVALVIGSNETHGEESFGGGAFVVGNAKFAEHAGITYNATFGRESFGGGIATIYGPHSTGADLRLKNAALEYNRTHGDESDGGAAFVAGNATIESSTIYANRTGGFDADGAGLRVYGNLTMLSVTVSGNETTGGSSEGGGLFVDGNTKLQHSTVTENRTAARDGVGGGISIATGALLTLHHSIVAQNIAPIAPDIQATNIASYSEFNLIGDRRGTSLVETLPGQANGWGNRIGGPIHGVIDAQLEPAAYNNGGGLTHRPGPESPAINAGSVLAQGGSGGIPQYDQRGFGFPRVQNGRIDIGAIEVSRIVVDSLTDENDGNHSPGYLSLREALVQSGWTQDDDTIVFDPLLFLSGPQALTLTMGEFVVQNNVRIYGPQNSSLTLDASGNDPTPNVNNGDGSRLFRVRSRQDGLFSSAANLEVHRLTLTGGDVQGNGGAILQEPSQLSGSGIIGIYDCLVYSNAASGNGGAISNNLTAVQIEDSTFSGNRAGGSGGALDLRAVSFYIDGVPTVPVKIFRSTITANSANQGGGLHSSVGYIGLTNTLIAGNQATVADTNERLFINTGLESNFSLIGGPAANLLGPLASNGGWRKSHALLPSSPAINGGDPNHEAGIGEVPLHDVRGEPWSRVVGGRIDMGAIEAQANPLAGDYNFNGLVDAADYSVWQDTFGSTSDFRADGSGAVAGVPDGVVDQFDYEFWKSNFGTALSVPGSGSLAHGGSSRAEKVQIAMEAVEDFPAAADAYGSIAEALSVGNRPSGILRRNMVSNSALPIADGGSTENLVAWLEGLSGMSYPERDDRYQAMDKVEANPESSHAMDEVFALLNNDFWPY